MSTASWKIGSVPVGDEHPVVFMAETGTFYNQDLGLARALFSAAAEAGVQVLKGEILHDPEVCLRDSTLPHRFNHAGGATVERYRELIERKVVPLSGYRELFRLAHELGLPFVASVYDFTGVDFMVQEGGAAIKIARHNIDNFPLIAHAARTGLPMIFDAGVVYFDEIAAALRCAREAGATSLMINHHPGANPAPAEGHHLRLIQTYKSAFGVPVGLTCHYRGDEMLYAAVGAGANLLEKGVVDDPDRAEQDVVSAQGLTELKSVVEKVRRCSAAMGNPWKQPQEPRDLSVRKGLVAKKDLAAGEVISLETVGFAWPPEGVPVRYWSVVEGQKTARAFQAGEPIPWKGIAFA